MSTINKAITSWSQTLRIGSLTAEEIGLMISQLFNFFQVTSDPLQMENTDILAKEILQNLSVIDTDNLYISEHDFKLLSVLIINIRNGVAQHASQIILLQLNYLRYNSAPLNSGRKGGLIVLCLLENLLD